MGRSDGVRRARGRHPGVLGQKFVGKQPRSRALGRSRRQRGQALVETVLLGPVLFFLILGSADLGRVFYYSIAATNAAREGARHAAYYDPVSNSNPYAGDLAALQAAQNEAPGLVLGEPSPPMSPPHCPIWPYADSMYPAAINTGYLFVCFNESDLLGTATPGQTVRVTVLYNFSPVTPLLATFAGSSIHVQATSVMVVQGEY